MTPVVARGRRRRVRPPLVAALVGLALLASACGTGADRAATPEDGLGDATPPAGDPGQVRTAVGEAVADRREQAMSGAALEIPAIGVSAPIVSLGLNDDRTMEVPEDFAETGWYRYSPTPGETGPAVIAGHVDSRSGPAVFFRLTELQRGDEVHVNMADGDRVTFTVQRIEQHPKDAFPHDRVYGDTDGPELRLITCGGLFDEARGAHRDNIIVYASATSA